MKVLNSIKLSPFYNPNEASSAAFQAASLSSARTRCDIRSPVVRFSSSCNSDDGAMSVFDGEQSPTLRRIDQSSSRNAPPSSRRSFLSLVTIAATATAPLPFSYPNNSAILQKPFPPSSTFVANAAETIGKDESCNDASCLGVWDGLLADCPHDKNKLMGGAGCVSSQDDTPGIFAEPWDYSENIPLSSSVEVNSYKTQMDKLILAVQTTSKQHGDDVKVLYQDGRYLRTRFTDGSSGEKSIGEFYFTPNDTTVQFRLGSVSPTLSLGRALSNKDRGERIRKALRYLKIPVLRNRKRTFFFVENDDLDAFGPGSSALGPPEEMSPGDLVSGEGRTQRGSDDVDPKLRIDWLESFPLK
mmetsp:Transcript_21961/g.47688  ORF Transcript_21961/g.47688 Transcript_21961/m.47688 type:complete len:357 (-) Transcript_21961:171-1241(-)|eukprot:CAMPEP_0172318336 /NCGR_PEP_ID=MMETSP1058-20130122/34603_1 /TAXON_ID=83371 /ORGANISM="Detonula confervacea, Strain CCMP 353" /LENGTH=356 /DNA_ID=CAMNT_0013033153 /DNA_START=78 /DNA_END=1148 /DNA_ORIENTATION=+